MSSIFLGWIPGSSDTHCTIDRLVTTIDMGNISLTYSLYLRTFSYTFRKTITTFHCCRIWRSVAVCGVSSVALSGVSFVAVCGVVLPYVAYLYVAYSYLACMPNWVILLFQKPHFVKMFIELWIQILGYVWLFKAYWIGCNAHDSKRLHYLIRNNVEAICIEKNMWT